MLGLLLFKIICIDFMLATRLFLEMNFNLSFETGLPEVPWLNDEFLLEQTCIFLNGVVEPQGLAQLNPLDEIIQGLVALRIEFQLTELLSK